MRTSSPRRRPSQDRVRPVVQQVIDQIQAPAYVRNGRLDILASNELGGALYSPVFGDSGMDVPNTARFIFLNPRSVDFFPDWQDVASDTVGILRASAGNDPYDRPLSDLVGELSARSDEFCVLWATHNVKSHWAGSQVTASPARGRLTLSYVALELPSGDGQRINVYAAEPGSKSEQALRLLSSWTRVTP